MVCIAGSQSREQIGRANPSFHNWLLLACYWTALSAATASSQRLSNKKKVRNVWTCELIHGMCRFLLNKQACVNSNYGKFTKHKTNIFNID